jgi:ABC-type sugar transport system ATPase subunit
VRTYKVGQEVSVFVRPCDVYVFGEDPDRLVKASPCRHLRRGRQIKDFFMAKIELENIAHSYRPKPASDDDFALKKVHTVWEDGGAYALLGSSGCGKTTMLNIISGLLTPSQGRVLFDGGRDQAAAGKAQHRAGLPVPGALRHHDGLRQPGLPLRNRKVEEGEVRAAGARDRRNPGLSPYLNRKASGLAPTPSRRSRWAGAWCARTWPPSSSTNL